MLWDDLIGLFSQRELMEGVVFPLMDPIATDLDEGVRCQGAQLLVHLLSVTETEWSTRILGLLSSLLQAGMHTATSKVCVGEGPRSGGYVFLSSISIQHTSGITRPKRWLFCLPPLTRGVCVMLSVRTIFYVIENEDSHAIIMSPYPPCNKNNITWSDFYYTLVTLTTYGI